MTPMSTGPVNAVRIVALSVVLAACGGSGEAGDAAPAAAPAPAPAAGAGAVNAEELALIQLEEFPGELDPALADEGESIFTVKGCVACHTIGGGRLVGPDLTGVVERRTPGWMAALIMSPDSMLREDPDARALFAEYMTPMTDQGLTVEEVRAILEFLRRDTSNGG
ncbi:MAG: cytochrome c [Gemmatimonadota bacterium]|nr:cytochrome c [Gemmatimonadota bacterium]